jgi:hypothetical protein
LFRRARAYARSIGDAHANHLQPAVMTAMELSK